MADPTVCAIMLANGREPMVRRAVDSFRVQTYQNKSLHLFNTGEHIKSKITHYSCYSRDLSLQGAPIGLLRNESMRHQVCREADIILHFDSDDWSHPNRIAEQVALLQSSGAECVGYNEMLFYREPITQPWEIVHCACGEHYPRSGAPCPKCHEYPNGEAWLYSNPNPRWALGTSLCYWHKTWEARPFPDLPHGEDTEWLAEVKCAAVNALHSSKPLPELLLSDDQPRMIASIHSGNTSPAYRPEVMLANEMQGDVWKRVPAWDAHCQERMKL